MSSSTRRFYEKHAAEYFNRTVDADMSHLYPKFADLLPEGGSILDAGCGSGRDLVQFSELGFRVTGLERSPSLAKMAYDLSKCEIIVGSFEDITFTNEFDGIWACASLLHSDKSLLPTILSNFYRALVKDRVLFASVRLGEGVERGSDGRQYTYYNENEFAGFIVSSGFTINSIWTTLDVIPGRDKLSWLNVLAIKSKN